MAGWLAGLAGWLGWQGGVAAAVMWGIETGGRGGVPLKLIGELNEWGEGGVGGCVNDWGDWMMRGEGGARLWQ